MNFFKTSLLLAAMTAIFMGAGYLIGGQGGMLIALVVALTGIQWALSPNREVLASGFGKVLLIGNLIASQFGDSRNWPFGAALSVIILIMLAIAHAFIGFYSKKSGKKVEISL